MSFEDCPALPAIISKISTNQAGGYKVVLDVPEIASEVIRQLIGSENRIVYQVGFNATGKELEQVKRGPGRPKNEGQD